MDTLRFTKGTTAPSIFDTITVDDAAYNLSSYSVRFQLRVASSNVLKVDAAATIVNATNGDVRYDWGATDLDTAGEYFGSWKATSGSTILVTPEFKVIVDALSPGDGVTTGAIAEQVRSIIPIAYNVLVKDDRFGEKLMQQVIDSRKFELFGTVVDPSLEATIYDVISQGFAGKLAAIDVIPAAADYWSDQQTQIQTTGTEESASYPDRIQHLWNVHKRLLQEIEDDRAKFEAVFGWKTWRRYRVPRVSTSGPLRSADPAGFPREFRATNWYGVLPWSGWS